MVDDWCWRDYAMMQGMCFICLSMSICHSLRRHELAWPPCLQSHIASSRALCAAAELDCYNQKSGHHLRQLHITNCSVQCLSTCRALSQVTQLRVQHAADGMAILTFVAEAMPQLVVHDLSFSNLK
jgi:hypothetical protein